MKTFFLPVNKAANKIFSSFSSQSARQCLDSFVYTSQTMVKEIIWTLQIVHLDIPLDLMRVLLIVSKKNFPDSEIAKNMSTGKTKSMYLIKHGIASYLKSLSEADINKSDCYLISFDENLNENTQMCKMDVYICYYDSCNKQVKVLYWGS